MNYYAVLYDRQLRPVGEPKAIPRPVNDFKIKQKAVEFDEADIECARVGLTEGAMFVTLNTQDGSIVWLGLVGNPQSSGETTKIYAQDFRRVLDQEVFLDFSKFTDRQSAEYHSVNALIEFLVQQVRDQVPDSGLTLPDFVLDMSDLNANPPEWEDGAVDVATNGVGNVWEALQAICSWYDLVIEVRAERSANGIAITLAPERIIERVSLNLTVAGSATKADLTSVNMVTVADHDSTNALSFVLLSTGDIVNSTDLDKTVADLLPDTAALLPSRYQTQAVRSLIRIPAVHRMFLRDEDTPLSSLYRPGETSKWPDNDEALSEALEELAKARSKVKVTLTVTDSDYVQRVLKGVLWEDQTIDVSGIDPNRALRFKATMYGYYADQPDLPKVLPVQEVERTPKRVRISFGRLSDYWFV